MKKVYICLMGMILAFTSLFFSACTKTYENMKISASGNNLVNNSISLAVGESALIEFSVSDMPKGASGEIVLSPSANIITAQVTDHDKNNSTSSVQINALAFGTCFLKATTKEGNKSIEIEINVSLAIEDFVLKDDVNLFAVKGENNPKKLMLSSSFFKFTPQNTSQTQIEFFDIEGNLITEIDPKNFDTNKVKVTAKSPFLSKTIEFEVQIIDEISSVEIYDVKDEPEHVYSKEQDSLQTSYKDLHFISNRKDFARKILKNVIKSGDNSKIRIERMVLSNSIVQCSEFDISKSYFENDNIIFDFELQSLNSGTTTIVFKVYYYGYEEYAIYRTFSLIVDEAPNQILLNDSESPEIQTLFDGAYSTIKSVQNLSILPYNSIFDKIEVTAVLEDGLAGNVTDYINFTIGGLSIFENGNSTEITNTNLPIIARGINQTDGKKITLKFKLIWGEAQGIDNNEDISISISYVVKTGANSLAILDKYNSNDGLFISLEEGTKQFKGFYVNDVNAFIEDSSIYCISSNGINTIDIKINPIQTEIIDSKKHLILDLMPQKAGESTWRIVLPNGVFRDFKITVIEKLQSLNLDVDEENSTYISDKTYYNGNLTALDTRLVLENDNYTSNLQLVLKTEPKDYNILNTQLYNLDIQAVDNENVRLDNLMLNLRCDKAGFDGKVLDYSIVVKVVDDFQLITPQQGDEQFDKNHFTGSLDVRAYIPFEGVEFEKSSISLYNYGDLGYYYKNLSKESNLLGSINSNIDLLTDTNVYISLSASEPHTYIAGEKILYVTNLGSYNLITGEFELDYSGKDLPEEFYIYASVKYFNEIYVASFKVIPQKYVQVSEVRTSNYIPQIYLSPTHQFVDLYTYILPQDAIHKDLIFLFEPSSNSFGNIVSLQSINNNGVRLTYANNGGGTGNLIIIPKSSISNTIENPNNSLKIPVIVGDGNQNSPFMISTADELINIAESGLDKHYMITSKIDLSAIDFSPLGEFSGSINGVGQGSIVGLNIKSTKEIDGILYGGLFTKNTGVISNLQISGKIELELNKNAKVGLIAGENFGTLQNVHVNLENSMIKVLTTEMISVGGVVGENNGKIATNIGGNYEFLEKIYSYNNFNLITLKDSVFQTFYAMQGKQNQSYFGGVVGINNGSIERIENARIKLYNDENYYVISNLSINGEKNVPNSAENTNFAVGAIAGKNTTNGRIFASAINFDENNYSNYLKAFGKIELANQAYNYLGGVLGINSGFADRIVSRVKVRSLGEITDFAKEAYLAGLVAFSEKSAIFTNSVLQNIEDASSLGVDLSLIYSKNFGLNVNGTGTDDDPYVYTKNAKVQIFGATENDGEISNDSLKAQTFISRTFVEPNQIANYDNYFGDILLGGSNGFYQNQFEIKDSQVLISQIEIDGKTPYALNCNNSTTIMAYTYFYEAKNSVEQDKLNSFNLQELPFEVDGEVSLISFDNNIISITNDGKLFVNGRGIARIKVISNLNQKYSVDVLVYVVGAVDGYNLYLNSLTTQENLITIGKTITIYEGQNIPIKIETFANDIVINGYTIEIISGDEIVLFEDEITSEKHVNFNKVGKLYLLEAVGDAGMQSLSINAKYSIYYDNNYYVSDNLYNNNLLFNVEHKKGAEKISSETEMYNNIEPNDRFLLNLEVITDDFNEKLEISSVKVNENYKKDNYFDVKEKNRVYEISVASNFKDNGKFILTLKYEDNSKDLYLYILNGLLFVSEHNISDISSINYYESQNLDVSMLLQQAIGQEIEFALKNDEGDEITLNKILKLNKINYFFESKFNEGFNENYQGQYFINFKAKNECEYGLEVNVINQTLKTILVNSFPLFDNNGNLQIGSGGSTTNYLSPNEPNYLKIEFFPLNSEFDYAEIKWNSSNSQLNAIVSWIDEMGNVKAGATMLSNGIRLSKNQILEQNNEILIKYDASRTNCFNGDVIEFVVEAFDKNDVVFKQIRNITIKYSIEVSFEILNKQIFEDGQDKKVYLVKGQTYDFSISSDGYLENEIVMTSSRDIVEVDLSAKKLHVVESGIVYPTNLEGVAGELVIYGRKRVDNQIVSSIPFKINFVVVDIALLSTGYLTNNVYESKTSVALGNTYILETKLQNGINAEYVSSLQDAMATKQEFENSINKNAIWQYQIGNLNDDGTYSYSENMWTTITDLGVTAQASAGYFIVSGEQNTGYVFTPLQIHSSDNPAYKFRVKYGFKYLNGKPQFKDFEQNTDNYFNRVEEWSFNIYQFSSLDAPTPVNNFDDFMAMEDGGYYILLNDLTLPSDYKPITAEIAGFDGNGKQITISSNLSFENLDKIGIFSRIVENAIIRNLKIKIENSLRFSIAQSGGANYVGILAGENEGIVTNCSVESLNANVRVVFSETGTTNYVAGLIGINKGYITNSRVKINLTAASNLAGFVGYNEGNIASCYVNESLIVNMTNEGTNKTAGFVVYNATDENGKGKIINCYISGIHSGFITTIYANDTASVVRSSTEVAGFVYENNGNVQNSYSDIPILSSSKNAGFVFTNNGKIFNTFSTCLLKSNSQESYGFVYDNSSGQISTSYYLADAELNLSINTSNKFISGLKEFKISDFSNEDNFSTFAFSQNGEITKGIWFFPQNAYQGQFNNENKTFYIGRPELISPNIIVESSQILDMENTFIDEETGEVTYAYKNAGNYSQGSVFNPYIIISAYEFENRIIKSNVGNINSNYYRLVTNINYDNEGLYSSNLFNTTFIGDIEGNGMKIEGYVIDELSSLSSAGLFSRIGNGSSEVGSVKNVILAPKYINLPNSNCVGALAGTLDSGYLFNVEVEGATSDGKAIVVLGKNIVGGVIGRAIGDYKIYNIKSSISANATYRCEAVLQEKNDEKATISSYFFNKTHSVSSLSMLSYSGTIAGILAGEGRVSFVDIDGKVASISEFAGLLFGGIGNGVVVQNIDLMLIEGQFIQPAVYGGIVAGECFGTLKDIIITSNYEISGLIKTIPFVPYAVGGAVGLLGTNYNLETIVREDGVGKLENVNVNTPIQSSSINIVGGLIGEMIGGEIEHCCFTSNLSGSEIAGGLIGQLSFSPSANLSFNNQNLLNAWISDREYTILNNSYVENGQVSVRNDDVNSSIVGGLIGKFELSGNNSSTFKISNAFIDSLLNVSSDIYGGNFNSYLGGLIGFIEVDSYVSQANNHSKFILENCYSLSKFKMSMRDLKGYSEEYILNFGYIFGSEFNLESSSKNVGYLSRSDKFGQVSQIEGEDNNFALRYYIDGTYEDINKNENNNGKAYFNNIKTQIKNENSLIEIEDMNLNDLLLEINKIKFNV